jgi:hypothetical protein
VIKLRGWCYGVFVGKNGGIRRNGGGRDEGCLSGHKLNIIDRFTDELHRQVNFVGNYIRQNNMSLYIVFFILFFFILILLIYTDEIFLSVFTNGYSKKI